MSINLKISLMLANIVKIYKEYLTLIFSNAFTSFSINLPMELINKKLETFYKVQDTCNKVKDIDLKKRVVTGMFNSYFFIDSDGDMLLPGAATKSIKERGPGSDSTE